MSKVKTNILLLLAITGGICLGVAGVSVSQQDGVSALAPPVTHSPSDLGRSFGSGTLRAISGV